LIRLRVTRRAAAVVWHAHARRLQARVAGHTPLLLVVLGLAGGLGGGALIGRWCLGLMLIAESGLLVYVGFARDDGTGRPSAGQTVPEILERARNLS
jgi:hypothetical protein